MAQLPPKVPNMTHNWYPSPHQSVSFNNAAAAAMSLNNNPSSWVDDFLDFSSVRRGSHRRSISDSVAFLDPQATSFADECRNVSDNNVNNDTGTAVNMSSADASCGFDRFDDDQLMSMFSDDLSLPAPPTASSSNPSTPSDQNSNNDERTTSLDHHHHHHHHIHPKNEPGEADSCGQNESQATHQQQPSPAAASNGDTIIDPKRVKRILANRQSAQRSRVRKLQYISELERSVTSLQTEVSALSPRVAFFDHQRLILNVDNSALKQRIAALAQDKIFKDAHQEALKKEIERLRQVHHHQNIKKMNSNSNDNAAPPQQQQRPPSQSQSQPPPPMSADTICYT